MSNFAIDLEHFAMNFYPRGYMPISLLTGFSEAFEKVMFKRLMRHLNSKIILVNEL
jgi:hypothetical protein